MAGRRKVDPYSFAVVSEWEDSFADFALWSLDYDLHCKMQFFGDMIRDAQTQEACGSTYKRENLLAQLPDVFTREQARALRARLGKDENPRFMLYTWKRRHLIAEREDGTYVKTTG